MARVIFGNHLSVIVPFKVRDDLRKFYCGILGATIYGDVPDESEFLRSARSVWLELKSDDVDAMRRKILDSGLVRKLELSDPHLYLQAPGGQCLRLVGIDEDLSFYEGAAEGPNVTKVKAAVEKLT